MSVTTLEQLTPGPVGVGTEFKSTETLPQEFVSFAQIKALDEPTRIAWESTDHQVFRTEWTFEIRPNADGTHLVEQVTFYAISAFGEEFLPIGQLQVEPENSRSLGRNQANSGNRKPYITMNRPFYDCGCVCRSKIRG